MAKNKKVDINNTELMPQVIGTLNKKKNNLGRVIIIFIAFIVTILYLPEITVIFNNAFGLHTAPTIKDNGDDDKNPIKNKNNDKNNIVYHEFSDALQIDEKDFTLNSFQLLNNVLSFNIINKTETSLDLSKKNYFLETYNESSTLLERFKVDFNVIGAKKSEKYTVDINKKEIKYLVFTTKTIEDYPIVDVQKDELGYGNITCKKDYRTLTYTFKNDELVKVKDEIVYNFRVEDPTYSAKFASYQKLCTNYELIDGIKSSFNSSVNGFTAVIELDSAVVKNEELDEKYYYQYKAVPKVINFEMQTYGFTCS